MTRNGTCWDDGPDHCPGCTYCLDARNTTPGDPVSYPDEQAARDVDLAQKRLNIHAAEQILARQQEADRHAARLEYAASARHPHY